MPAWDRFIDTFFRRRDPAGPDQSTLDRLTWAEREQAFQLLLAAAVQRPGEIFAIQGLGHLRDARAAGSLREVMRRQGGVTALYAAFALWCVDEDPEALDTLCHPLVRRRRVGAATAAERSYAAVFLKQIDEPAALRALAVAIHDPDYQVRFHAYEGLGPVLGRSREVWNYVCKPDVHHHVRKRIDAALHRAGLA